MSGLLIKLQSGEVVEFEDTGYIVSAEPNNHGGLVVYRTHENMIGAQSIASYAVGEWISHETVWDES